MRPDRIDYPIAVVISHSRQRSLPPLLPPPCFSPPMLFVSRHRRLKSIYEHQLKEGRHWLDERAQPRMKDHLASREPTASKD
jgi:hypothetical protein